MNEKLLKHLKKWSKWLFLNGIPSVHLPVGILFVAITGWVLAGFGVGEWLTLVTSDSNYIVELFLISLGGRVVNKAVGKMSPQKPGESGL